MDGRYFDAIEDMADLVKCPYSKRQIEDAGDLLKGVLNDPNDEETLRVFRIAHSWRDAHVIPMQKLRRELATTARKHDVQAITAARLKRMKSIRKKLRTQLRTLYQIQDVAGSRAIVKSTDELNRLVTHYRNGSSAHELTREYDYIANPRDDGYRSHHLIMKFRGDGKLEEYNRHRVELQVRTRLQHAWATAVEAVGLARNEDLKGGSGSPDWLRLFAIMGSEIAIEEDRPEVPGVSASKIERRQELAELNQKLNAAKNLHMWNNAVKHTERILASRDTFYLIQFDNTDPDNPRTTFHPVAKFLEGAEQLRAAERNDERRDTVIVEMDRAENLREAYPNYFLDVTIFNDRLNAVLENREPTPFNKLYPDQAAPPRISDANLIGSWVKFLRGRD